MTVRGAADRARDYILPRTPARAMFQATVVLVLGSVLTGVSMPQSFHEVEIYRHCAIFLGLTLVISLFVQARGNLRRLISADVVALSSLYFLTFAEFLNPQVRILYSSLTGQAQHASWLVLMTVIAIACGRLIRLPGETKPFGLPHLSARGLVVLALVCFLLGYLWPLITVNFNPVSLVTEALGPRFTQPWQRSRMGGWSSFLTELNLMHYAFAALVGVIFTEQRRVSLPVKAILAALVAFMLFLDFAGGTRYILIVKLGLMVSAYVAGTRRLGSVKMWVLGALGLAAMWMITGEMLRLREQGLDDYISGTEQAKGGDDSTYFLVDNNMITIARTIAVFPVPYSYPGSEVLVTALTKWVPRALWPGKPEAWGNSLEDAFGLDGSYTLAVTLTGEAYLVGGWLPLIVIGLLIGMICAMWNRRGELLRSNMDLILYISAFFALSICMRSLQFVTVALLPTLAIYVFGKILSRRPRPTSASRASGAYAA